MNILLLNGLPEDYNGIPISADFRNMIQVDIILHEEDGNEIELEQIAVVTDEGEVYAVLHAIGDPEDEVLVFKIDQNDEESVTMVEDEELGNKILKYVMDESQG